MSLKIKMSVSLDEVFVQVFAGFCMNKLPATAGYRLSQCVKAINAANHEGLIARDKVVKAYGTPDEKNESLFTFTPENQEKANAEIKEIAEIEVDMPIEEKVKISVSKLEDSKVNVSPFEFETLQTLVEFVE